MGKAAGRFIVIEGNNGAGKTSVAVELSSRAGAAYFHFPRGFSRFRERVRLDASVGPQARLAYYIGATLHLAELVTVARRTRPVVCDRYLAAPLSLLIAENVLAEEQILRLSAPFEKGLPLPDLTVLLIVRYETAVERIRGRRSGGATLTPVEERVLSSRGFFTRREDALRRHSSRLGPVLEIDTSDRSTDQTVDEIGAVLPRAAVGS